MTWLKYITIHPRINIGSQYIINTSEYIPKLQLHQHSLLTRKVFSLQIYQHKSSSLYHLDHHQVLIILTFNSSPYSIHLHLQVIFIIESGSSLDLDHHHWIWIITRSGSLSLDLDHYSICIITGQHHWIWIITRSGSLLGIMIGSGSSLNLDEYECYLMILLVIGSSIEPTLLHAGCRPSH